MAKPAIAQYPFAAAPDIIRANQKDTFFQGILAENLLTVLRSIYGARFVHKYALEGRTTGEFLYLLCTTLIGNRTLGEEYCDIVQVENGSLRLPSLLRRSGYIISSIILPYLLTKSLPGLRTQLRKWVESDLIEKEAVGCTTGPQRHLQQYLSRNISALTSPAPIYAVGLAVFYFTGAYYHLGKRTWGLRYLFTKRIDPSDQRIGYEVLGVLLVLQLGVQAWLHIQNTYNTDLPSLANPTPLSGGTVLISGGVEMSLGPPQAEDILLEQAPMRTDKDKIESHTATPVLAEARFRLDHSDVMKWIEGPQQRKCTLCLEEFKDPSATTCGHVFCWLCISDWIKEKPECPLCRQRVLAQHILPLRE